jgi:hypothetical protein
MGAGRFSRRGTATRLHALCGFLAAFPVIPLFREIRAVIERDYLRVSDRLATFAEDRGAHPFHPIIDLQGRKYSLGKR